MLYYLINIFHLTPKAKNKTPNKLMLKKPRVWGFRWGYLVAMLVQNSQGDLLNFIISAYGIHPSCGHACLQRGSYTNNCLIKDQVAPEHFWGLIHQGTRPRIDPCLRHGYP
jgi:hypothetical protein